LKVKIKMKKNIFFSFLLVILISIFLLGFAKDVSAYCTGCVNGFCGACNKDCDNGCSGGCKCNCENCGPPPCTPSCGECGPNGCGGTCTDTCGAFKSGCSLKTCTYQLANISGMSLDTPCISEIDNSRQFTVSGTSNYCGEITIQFENVNIPERFVTVNGDVKGVYSFSESFTIPNNEILAPEPQIKVKLIGNRERIKDSKDEHDYTDDCKVEQTLKLDYLNFFYCPDYPDSTVDQSIYDYYDDLSDFEFNSQEYRTWDPGGDCITDDSITACAPRPTDCIDDNGDVVRQNEDADADSDGEIELCISKENIQGGWLDPDLSEQYCNMVDMKNTKWYDCQNPNQDAICTHAKDDFPLDNQGLCCGDDPGEGVTETRSFFENQAIAGDDPTESLIYEACCDVSQGERCVDENGACYGLGQDVCSSIGSYRAVCSKNNDNGEYYWDLTYDVDCKSMCERCDVINDDFIDIDDVTAIEVAVAAGSTDLAYDVDLNGEVNEADYQRCKQSDVFAKTCLSCQTKVDDGEDKCVVDDDTNEITFGRNDEIICSPNEGDNSVLKKDFSYCGPVCDVKYDEQACDMETCGGCETNTDCRIGEFCNLDKCACEEIGCLPGTSLCTDGTCSSDCNFQGCIVENNICESGEGCACYDCIAQQDSCSNGAVCGTDKLCGCPAGTALCEDGTCSDDCDITDTGFQGCLDYNSLNGYDVFDYSGNNNHGKNNGAILVNGKSGKGYNFDGVNDYIVLPMSYGYNSIDETTVCAWVKSSSKEEQIIISFDRSEVWRLALKDDSNTKTIGWDTTTSDNKFHDQNTTLDYTDNLWHHVCAIYNSGSSPDKKIYVDSLLVASDSTQINKNLGSIDERLNHFGFIGVGSEAAVLDGEKGPNYYFNGSIDEIRIYSRELSANEIFNLHNFIEISNDKLELHYSFEPKNTMQPNGICEFGEGCACSDCYGDRDSCVDTAICNEETELCECVPTEDYETSVYDGLDNDCDGLVDEPIFDEYGAYLWESNCDYYLCIYSDDLTEYKTNGKVASNEGFTRIRQADWENKDSFSATPNLIEFISHTYVDIDCMILNANDVMEFGFNFSDNENLDNIFLEQRKYHPLTNPFSYADPSCALGCQTPGMCGVEKQVLLSKVRVGCGYDECIFDCGGHWMDVESVYDIVPVTLMANPEDYCADCEEDMICSDYSNEYSCHYDSCNAAETWFGCEWNGTDCFDAFVPCVPGTTLCSDGVCRQECDANAYCNGYPDGVCDVGEGCACDDCESEQGSCTDGAICDFEQICGCPAGLTMCEDGTCSDTCDYSEKQGCVGEPNDLCEFGEGCACSDCEWLQDSCVNYAICNYVDKLCNELDTYDCPVGKTVCSDMTCDTTCDNHGGKRGCIGEPNDICEYGEGCACSDCYDQRDSCAEGLVCSSKTEVCKSTSSGGGGSSYDDCDDLDNDGYNKISSSCDGSRDCDDTNVLINPGVTEVCGNDKDDDCDLEIDEDCVGGIVVTIDSAEDVRVLKSFDLVMKINNLLDYDIDNIELSLDLPQSIKSKRDSYVLQKLKTGDTAIETATIYVKDYKENVATFDLNVEFDQEKLTDELSIDIQIPEFLIAADPVDVDSGSNCYNLYYVLNTGDVSGDIELNIIDPDALFSKTVNVDYEQGVETNGLLIQQMLSNPYCLAQRKNYEIHGHLYQSSGFFSDNTITSVVQLNDEDRPQVHVTIDIDDINEVI
jgi:hypothetical protein